MFNENPYSKINSKKFEEIMSIVNASERPSAVLGKKKNAHLLKWIDLVIPKLNSSIYSVTTKLYWIVNGLTDFPKCANVNCSNTLEFKNVQSLKKGYARYCTSKCGLNDEKTKEKAAATCLERYGEISPGKVDFVKEKSRQTCLKKYGVEYSFQSENNKQKSKKTSLEKYGTEIPSQSKNIIEKTNKTKLERYGEKQPWHSEEAFEKRKETWCEKYGVDHPMKLDSFKESQKQSCIEKYGVDCYLKLPSIFRHTKELVFDKCVKNNEFDTPLFTFDDFFQKDKTHEFEFKCKTCGTVFKSIHINGRHKRCPNCFPTMQSSSNEEKDLVSFLKSVLEEDIVENDRKTISPKELDIYIPNKKLAIEFDGLYWHSEQEGKNETYHLKKTEECEKQGIQLIHIFEDEWIYKQDIVKSRLKNLIGIYDSICYARQCEVREVYSRESFDFQETNHIQGAVNSKVNLGLFYKDELVSLMTFSKPRFDKKHEWELVRFCNKLDWHIPGAASKLLTYFERNWSPKNIVSYADRRWSRGNLYEKLGFTLDHVSSPNYWYFNYRTLVLESRIKYQKHKLPKVLEKFDSKLSEVQNMDMNGYGRIFDCGNLVFVKNYK